MWDLTPGLPTNNYCYHYTSDSLWKTWLVESIQSIHNSLWTWHDKCNICCRYYICHVRFNVFLVNKPLGVFSSETKWLNASLLFLRMNYVKNYWIQLLHDIMNYQTLVSVNTDLASDNIQLSPEGEVNRGGYNLYWDAKHRGIYPLLFTDPERDSCFSIYQIRWIKKCCFNFFFWNFRDTMRHFSFCSQNSE